MPTKRRAPKQRVGHITPEALAIFRAALELKPKSEEWVEQSWALHHELGLKPWQVQPVWIDPDDPCDMDRRSHADMIELRLQLDAAVAEAR